MSKEMKQFQIQISMTIPIRYSSVLKTSFIIHPKISISF